MITLIGENLLQGVAGANGGTHIATVFPEARVVVTVPGIHCTQREAYVDWLEARRRAEGGGGAMTVEERDRLMLGAVDLIIKEAKVLIRPDPEHMELAFEADAVLQEAVPKRRIHFLFVSDPRVRNAISRRGAAWRIHAPPRSAVEIERMIAEGRVAAGGQAIYYYNPVTGTRFLTCEQFARLGALSDEELRRHLSEIACLAGKYNTCGNLQLRSFMMQGQFRLTSLGGVDWAAVPAEELRRRFAAAVADYQAAVTPGFEHDDLEDASWRNHMYEALCGTEEDELPGTDQLGLSAEYFRQIEWLPGARIEGGEIIFDASGEESAARDAEGDRVVYGLICNLLQEQMDVDFINIGRLVHSLSLRDKPAGGRREVYVEHYREKGAGKDTLQLIRMQKWGVREHLDEGKDLLQAMIESEEYTAFIMDRRLGCRQLGMNIARRMSMRKVAEIYQGRQAALHGTMIWSPYFQREYFVGAASDKIPPRRLREPGFAVALARLLGRAAAPNMIVGRSSSEGKVIFDDGDEVVVCDAAGMPTEIVVADHTSTFGDFRQEFERVAAAYARPVIRRAALVPDAGAFAQAYMEGFRERFTEIQRDYLERPRAFEELFRHRPLDPAGNLAFRWKLVLARLARAKADDLAGAIRKHIQAG